MTIRSIFSPSLFRALSVLLALMFGMGVAVARNLPDFTALAEQLKPVVVSISTLARSEQGRVPGPSGSGFIIDADGFVLTNRHVVSGVDVIRVRLSNGREYSASLMGEDEGTDIALLKIDARGLTAARLGNPDELKVGEWVLGFGAPFGFEHTVTAGIVSAKGRTLSTEQYVPYIQTDVAINRGNSGGPLVNLKGEVVGINSQILSATGGFMGLSFAIPMNLAMQIAQQLQRDGQVRRGFLGVQYQDLTFDLARTFGRDSMDGALVTLVAEETPAQQAGLEQGDIIIKVGSESIRTASDLPYVMGLMSPGQRTQIQYFRKGKIYKTPLTVGEREPVALLNASEPEVSPATGLGMEVAGLDEETRRAIGIDSGVVVSKIMPGPAADAGIREGDIIQTFDHQKLYDVSDYRQIVEQLPKSAKIAALVTRPGGASRYLVIELNRR